MRTKGKILLGSLSYKKILLGFYTEILLGSRKRILSGFIFNITQKSAVLSLVQFAKNF